MPTLPSGRTLALSMNHILPPSVVTFKCAPPESAPTAARAQMETVCEDLGTNCPRCTNTDSPTRTYTQSEGWTNQSLWQESCTNSR
jgi:hypothetical protein